MKIEDEIRQYKFSSPYQKAVINLIFTANWLFSKHQEFFKPFGITLQQYNILRILRGQHPNSISVKEIKSRMLDRNSDVSRLLARLLAKKLVAKRVCKEDNRSADVFITTAGLTLLKTIKEPEAELDHILALTPKEAIQLSNLLDKCRRS